MAGQSKMKNDRMKAGTVAEPVKLYQACDTEFGCIMVRDENGGYVHAEDYDALAKENALLQRKLALAEAAMVDWCPDGMQTYGWRKNRHGKVKYRDNVGEYFTRVLARIKGMK